MLHICGQNVCHLQQIGSQQNCVLTCRVVLFSCHSTVSTTPAHVVLCVCACCACVHVCLFVCMPLCVDGSVDATHMHPFVLFSQQVLTFAAYLLSGLFMDTYDMGVDTIFLCACKL